MTAQDAIEILNNLAVPIHAEAAFDMAVDALQKQIPKKPIPYYYKDKCPNPACGLIVKIGEKYCKGCGQTLRWGE